MRKKIFLLPTIYLTFQSQFCFSEDSLNVSIIPDFFGCHDHYGIDVVINENSTLGIMGAAKCTSDRPTYGDTNNQVNNTFNRVYFPWRYAFKGVFKDGYFVQTMIGIEKSRFKSNTGSRANVTFYDLTLHGGHQWFWGGGFNISALAGVALLKEKNLAKDIVSNENKNVINFLDKNTKSNIHIGVGVILGWSF